MVRSRAQLVVVRRGLCNQVLPTRNHHHMSREMGQYRSTSPQAAHSIDIIVHTLTKSLLQVQGVWSVTCTRVVQDDNHCGDVMQRGSKRCLP